MPGMQDLVWQVAMLALGELKLSFDHAEDHEIRSSTTIKFVIRHRAMAKAYFLLSSFRCLQSTHRE